MGKQLLPLVSGATLWSTSVTAMAHDGHGQAGMHWHATDVLGFVVVGLLIALAAWRSR
jgi:hypothetical protein